MRLKNRVAVITGAGRGIGREAALLFAREGARVAVVDFDEETSRQVVREIKSGSGEAIFTCTDVSSREQVQEMVEGVVERFGTINVLVNNAGITRDSMLLKMEEEDWDRVLAVNLL